MGITHLAIDLSFWHQSCYRVYDHDIYSAGTYHSFCNLQPLLTVIRLGNIEIINIYADIFCINRI